MSRETLIKLYSGKTAIGAESDIYFSPDNTFKGLIGKTKDSPITGTWSVTDNELCIYSFRKDKLGTYSDCYEYWSDGSRIISLWSVHSDRSRVDRSTGYVEIEQSNFRAGDLISERYYSTGGT
jgi:hypothetical protein